MGIDIYLGGYDAYNLRAKSDHDRFDAVVKLRDSHPRDSMEHDAAQKLVDEAADAVWSGRNGYLRSSYNGRGLFNVLEEVFGFDVANELFPGHWGDDDYSIDATTFMASVEALQDTALVAITRGRLDLPWIDLWTDVTGRLAPDANQARTGGEEFGRMVRQLIGGMCEGIKLEPGDVATAAQLGPRHQWYLTDGIRELREFGELAKREAGENGRVHVYINY